MLAAVFTAGAGVFSFSAAGLLSSFLTSSLTFTEASAFTTGGEVAVPEAQGGGVLEREC